MEIITLSVTNIDASDRLRPIDEDYANLIGASMAQYGQRAPVEVLPARADGLYPLISGAHRWRGAAIHGLPVLAVVRHVDADTAELMQIDENLSRHELNALDEAEFLRRRQEIWRKLYPETKAGGARKQNDKLVVLTQTFSQATADKLRVSERSIQRKVKRAKELIRSGVIDRVRGTWLATRGAHLDAIIKLDSAEQRAVIELLLEAGDGEDAITVADAIRQVRQAPAETEDAVEKDFRKLCRLWERAAPAAKQRFRTFLATEGRGKRS